MRKILYSSFLSLGTALALQAQTPDTVRIGAGYANQVWYSLQNGMVGTPQPKDNWDLAFEINGGQSASILANTQKANFALYKAPFSVLQWSSVDSAGIRSWPFLNNSDKSWAAGAFNSTTKVSDSYDFGWGRYDMNTHFITGDSVYVVKLSATVYKKLTIDNLGGGSYNFTFANLDGSNEKSVTIAKSAYPGKNFAYYNLGTSEVVDREPAATSWDLTFVKYTTLLDNGGIITPYGVTGILQNKGVQVAQIDDVADVKTFADSTGRLFSSDINTIGYDWKTYDFVSSSFKIKANQVFFIKDKTGKYWKVVFTGFASANGQFSFSKEPLQAVTTGIENESGTEVASFALYPNPASGENLHLLFGSRANLNNAKVTISDAQGTVVYTEELNMASGIQHHEMAISNLKNGLYFISVSAGGKNRIQKFVKQ
jgi:hypothetical protein